MASREIATMRYDAILLPTLPQGTCPSGFYDMSLDINISSQPARALPLAESAGGLTIGVQLIGRPGDESTLFRLVGQLEIGRLLWARRRPEVHAARATI